MEPAVNNQASGSLDQESQKNLENRENQETMDQSHDHSKMVMAVQKESPDLSAQVKVEEQLGKYIDFTAKFVDETRGVIDLRTIFDKPVLLLPIFFTCTSACDFLQAELANVLNHVGQIPGKDFNIITLSFADDENSSHASRAKKNYGNLIKREVPKEDIMNNWYYLTGDRENIRKLTDSLGFYFIKTGNHLYIHPNVLIILARDGKITRYLYGIDFLPFDVGMALSEAQKGEPGISIKRGVLSFCFDYDPENKTYVFKIFRITGTTILILLTGFIIFLTYPSKKGQGQ
jgi:protein SCO1/2